MNVIRKVALAIFKDKKMLLARSAKHETAFFAPGGKIEAGETEQEALIREIQEELSSRIDMATLEFLVEVEGPAHVKTDSVVNIRLYSGNLLDKPRPSGEVAELEYFNTTIDEKHHTASGKLIFTALKKKGLID